MARLLVLVIVMLLCVTAFAPAWQRKNVNSSTWSGVIINSGCTADEAFAELDKCLQGRSPGEKLSLYDDTTRQVYELDAQDQATHHFGESVTVQGTLQGNTIRVASIIRLTSIGLEVGQMAPPFSARDQLGHEQTLAELKGPKGTILLFFRSADW